jgi:hypothetical protein
MPTILVDFWQHVTREIIFSINAKADIFGPRRQLASTFTRDGAQSIDPGPKSDDDVRQCHVAAGAAQ